jgi:hypothetical protein
MGWGGRCTRSAPCGAGNQPGDRDCRATADDGDAVSERTPQQRAAGGAGSECNHNSGRTPACGGLTGGQVGEDRWGSQPPTPTTPATPGTPHTLTVAPSGVTTHAPRHGHGRAHSEEPRGHNSGVSPPAGSGACATARQRRSQTAPQHHPSQGDAPVIDQPPPETPQGRCPRRCRPPRVSRPGVGLEPIRRHHVVTQPTGTRFTVPARPTAARLARKPSPRGYATTQAGSDRGAGSARHTGRLISGGWCREGHRHHARLI